MSKLVFCALLFTLSCIIFVQDALGHGMMLEPPNRSSMWRFVSNAPINYDDNANYCGGRAVQWEKFDGKCGVCGDPYDEAHPQRNENTGIYGRGIVPRRYKAGSKIDVSIDLTVNHLGNFEYSICVLSNANAPEPGESCFRSLILGDGSPRYYVSPNEKVVNHTLILPYDLRCERCVLRWHYNTGNSWGVCANGTATNGCGPQETFRTCSDISIY